MGHMNPIKANEIKVGDILFVTTKEGFAFTNQEVKDIDLNNSDCITTESTDENVTEGFGVEDGYYTFYLIERPKKPLPTGIGSVVEVDGEKYVRVLKDSEWYYEWVKVENTDRFETISTESLAELDYTVV